MVQEKEEESQTMSQIQCQTSFYFGGGPRGHFLCVINFLCLELLCRLQQSESARSCI